MLTNTMVHPRTCYTCLVAVESVVPSDRWWMRQTHLASALDRKVAFGSSFCISAMVLQGQDQWRKHPIFRHKIKGGRYWGLNIALGAYAVYMGQQYFKYTFFPPAGGHH